MSGSLVLTLIISLLSIYLIGKNLGLFIMLRGMRIYSKGDKRRGLDRLRKALSFPIKPDHKLSCGFLILKEGNLDEADKILSTLISETHKKFNPHRARVYYSLVLWKKGMLDLAIESMESLLADDYRTDVLYCNLGYYLIEKGDYRRALEVNLEGLDYNGKSTIIRDNLALNYIKLEEWDKAEELSEALLNEKPGFPEAYYNRALISMHRKEWEEARELLASAEKKSFNFLSTISPDDVSRKISELGQHLI